MNYLTLWLNGFDTHEPRMGTIFQASSFFLVISPFKERKAMIQKERAK
jgi:hypothetical protein